MRAVESRGGQFGADRRVDIGISREPTGFAGSFRIGGHRGTSNERTVHAPTCEEVVEGLAVATALALHVSPSSPTEVATLPALEPVTTVPHSTPVRDEPKGATPLRVGPAFTLTAFGGVSFGMVPSTPLPRYELSVTWASLARQGESGRIVGPVMRLGLNLYGGASYEMAGSTTKIGAQALTIGPCYAPVYSERGLVLLTCLDLTAGLIGASTVDRETNANHESTLGFGSVGAGLEAAYNLGRHFHLALRGGANVLVAPISFRGADGAELFHSSRYNGYVTLGAGGHF